MFTGVLKMLEVTYADLFIGGYVRITLVAAFQILLDFLSRPDHVTSPKSHHCETLITFNFQYCCHLDSSFCSFE